MTHDCHIGPFTLDAKIGEGGMGVVYRGTHRETGVPVALKIIRQVTDARARRRFHEEVQSHARLLHPGIVYLFEYGEVDERAAEASGGELAADSPFVAMELADRGTVRDIVPLENWTQLRALLVQVLDALAYAHARHVVHRDLKPENFLLFDPDDGRQDDIRIKLADFGISHAMGGERGAHTSELESPAGTPAYMAPEQFHGNWRQYGPWTDLYALGCVAWELACQQPVFRGNPVTIAVKHEEAERPPLEPAFPVPETLEAWIHRAMARDPEKRFRRAAEAAYSLPPALDHDVPASDRPLLDHGPDRGDDADSEPRTQTVPMWQSEPSTLAWTNSSETADDAARAETLPDLSAISPAGDAAEPELVPTRPPLPDDWRPRQMVPSTAPLVGAGLGLFALREAPFVNRRTECDRVWERLQAVVDGGGTEYVIMTGETGTGKSRLAEWIATRAHEVGHTTTLHATHTSGSGRTEGLRGAFERQFRTMKMDRGEVYAHLCHELGDRDADGGEAVERDARALTEFLRPTDDDAEAIDGPRYRFSGAPQRRELIVRILRRLSEDRPVVLWLDDLHWGLESLGLLEHICEMADPAPDLLVLATVRSDVLARDDEMADRLEALESAAGAEWLELAPLSRPHQRKLLDGLLPLEDDLAARLAEHTEGRPLFAIQLLDHWIEAGDLEAGEYGFHVPDLHEAPLPDHLHQLWMDRLDRLLETYPPDDAASAREALELAAALGREIVDEEWESLLNRTDLSPPDDLIDRLVESGFAEPTAEGWAFAHRLIVELLGRRARQEERWRDHHRRCAEMLADRLDGVPGPRARLADHRIEAGEPERALAPLLDEIELAAEYDNRDEQRRLLARRADLLDDLDLPDDHPRRLEQTLQAAHLTTLTDKLERARELATKVWETLDPTHAHLRSEAALVLAQIARQGGRPGEAEQWGTKALETSRRVEADRVQCGALRELTWNAFFEGDLSSAERYAREAYAAASQLDDPYHTASSLRALAFIHQARGDEEASALFERVRDLAIDRGYVKLEAQALNGLGDQARLEGRLEEARDDYRRYLRKMHELALPVGEAIANLGLAQVEVALGDFETADGHIETGRDRLEAVGALESRRGLLLGLDLARAAGTRDEARFHDLVNRLPDPWPDDWQLVRDHPWLLEKAGRYADEAGWSGEARQVWRLARDLWERLGDEEAAEALERRLSSSCE